MDNPKEIVSKGYDTIADTHLEWCQTVRVEERAKYTGILLESLPEGAAVLELGCGTGIPTTRILAHKFTVTGVDLSPRHVEMARKNVPNATFICGDMTGLDFPPASFDGVAAFFSIIHVPRGQHSTLLSHITAWLKPGGIFVATMGANDLKDSYEENWLGAPMYWSHFDTATNMQLITDAGLKITSAIEETSEEFGVPITFLWVVARKAL